MDNNLLDELLIDLLRMPAAQRTQEKVLANLALATTAAGALDSKQGSLHNDHLALAAALERLASTLGDQYRWGTRLRLGPDTGGIELCALIEPVAHADQLPRFIAFGSTARAALAGLNNEIRKAQEAKPAQTVRQPGKLRLKRLAEQLAAEQPSA